jgi:hypothetical protein
MAVPHVVMMKRLTPAQRARVEARAKELMVEEVTLRSLQKVPRNTALASLQQQAKRSGKNRFSQEEIDAEIAIIRKERAKVNLSKTFS